MPALLRLRALLLAALLAVLTPSLASAASGDLDPSYGTAGTTSIDARPGTRPDPLTPYAAQDLGIPGGGVVITGTTTSGAVFVAKYTAAGQLDPGFGTAGLKLLDFGPGSVDEPGGLSIDSLGRIVVAGRADDEAFLARFTTAGQLDTTFAGDGVIVHPTPGDTVSFSDLAIDTDDGIYVATSSAPTTIRRYTAAGTLDTAFGIAGVSTPQQFGDIRLGMDYAARRLVIGGSNSGNSYRFARLQGMTDPSPGSFDTSFSGDGQLDITSPQAAGTFKDLDVAADRTIAVIGDTGSDAYTVIRLADTGVADGLDGDGVVSGNPTASPADTPFSIDARSTPGLYLLSGSSGGTGGFHRAVAASTGAQGGAVLTGCETGTTCTPVAATTLSDAIYVVGTQTTGSRAYVEARVLSTGLLKTAFNGDGYAAFTRNEPWGLNALRSALDADGNLTTFGQAGLYNDESSFLLRQTATGSPLAAFGSGGSVVADLQPSAGENTPAAAQASDGAWYVAPVSPAGSADLVLRRFTSSGLDGAFGVGGAVTVRVAQAGRIFQPDALAIDSRGRVIVAGEELEPGGAGARDSLLVRVLPQSGIIDPNFNGGAPVRINRAGAGVSEQLRSLVVTSDGSLVAGGVKDSAAFVVQLDGAGAPKAGFGTSGVADLAALGTCESGSPVLVGVDAAGTVFAGASVVRGGSDREVAIARLTATGTIDPGFGTAGIATVAPADTASQSLADLTLDHAGRVVFVGARTPNSGSGISDSLIGRLTTAGQPDGEFASGGRVVLDLSGGNTDRFVSVHLRGRKILAVGDATDGATGTGRVVTAQLIGDPEPPATPAPTPAPAPTPIASPTTPSVRLTIAAPKRLRARRAVTLRGTTTATGSTTSRVQVAIRQVKKGKCLFLRSAKGRTLRSIKPVRGTCTKPVFLSAKGTTNWSLALRQGLPAGTYEITARATLAASQPGATPTTGSAVLRVKVK